MLLLLLLLFLQVATLEFLSTSSRACYFNTLLPYLFLLNFFFFFFFSASRECEIEKPGQGTDRELGQKGGQRIHHHNEKSIFTQAQLDKPGFFCCGQAPEEFVVVVVVVDVALAGTIERINLAAQILASERSVAAAWLFLQSETRARPYSSRVHRRTGLNARLCQYCK